MNVDKGVLLDRICSENLSLRKHRFLCKVPPKPFVMTSGNHERQCFESGVTGHVGEQHVTNTKVIKPEIRNSFLPKKLFFRKPV
jgi:hypothetical protein